MTLQLLASRLAAGRA